MSHFLSELRAPTGVGVSDSVYDAATLVSFGLRLPPPPLQQTRPGVAGGWGCLETGGGGGGVISRRVSADKRRKKIRKTSTSMARVERAVSSPPAFLLL